MDKVSQLSLVAADPLGFLMTYVLTPKPLAPRRKHPGLVRVKVTNRSPTGELGVKNTTFVEFEITATLWKINFLSRNRQDLVHLV